MPNHQATDCGTGDAAEKEPLLDTRLRLDPVGPDAPCGSSAIADTVNTLDPKPPAGPHDQQLLGTDAGERRGEARHRDDPRPVARPEKQADR